MTTLRRGRWALSFADLCLLLLGFFVLLNAAPRRAEIAVAQLSEYFGGKPSVSAMLSIPAARLFQPGEAMLTRQGALQLQRIGKEAVEKQHILVMSSVGEDRAGRRFDRWELSAARLTAAARALRKTGLAEDQIQLRGLDEAPAGERGQRLVIWRKEVPKTIG
ncbi:flagellar motor protein MotB [Rhizorhapis suberifaciens]|uniref:Flagellar motor protein MotB n=1 Tax=Rhizorhapis suberifaciens TaxID=13656 RepID=A0A840HYG2_9SPHN|nr:flagellar motor protein MotB [Rhizorhapis suberifaciens]MBB4642456.1 flagellar motor protein MotB [Rhizorhapis suberifaciens]